MITRSEHLRLYCVLEQTIVITHQATRYTWIVKLGK